MDLETRKERRGGGRAYRSRLESFVEFIREQRQHRRTWQEIATLLRTERGCAITFQGLHQFYRRYLKRQTRPHWESEAVMAQPVSVKAPAPARQMVLAATPQTRPFRQPNPGEIKLNDPTQHMNTTRRIHLNPQSKGNLGKSFEAEFRTAWLDKLGVPWNGSDLDDRHHTFANRHPEAVRSYHLGNEHESKTALLSLFRRVLKDSAPVHVIDTRAQADALILGALEELQVLDVCAEQGVRLTFFLFPTDDTESMTNAGRLLVYAGDRVDYVIVHNPAKARGDLFKGSQLEKQLMEFGAKSVTLPAVTPTTLLAIEKAEAIAKRGLSFAELSHVEAGHLERLLAGEIQWAMQKLFRQYDAIADLLLPTEFVSKEKTTPAKEKAKTEPQPQLNFGE